MVRDDRARWRGVPSAAASGDAHAHRSDCWRWHTTLRGGALCVWRQCRKADGGRIRPENGVNVLEECVADDPLWAGVVDTIAATTTTGRRVLKDGPETLAVRGFGIFKIVRCDGPCLAAERERHVNGRRAGCIKECFFVNTLG